MQRFSVQFFMTVITITFTVTCGCNSKSSTPPVTDTNSARQSPAGKSEVETVEKAEKPAAKRRTLAPVEIGSNSNSAHASTKSPAEQLNAVRDALKPFQILLGNWKALSQKTIAEQPAWAYDWVSDPKSPGLRLTSDKGIYIRDGRLSYLPDSDQFEFNATDAEGVRRTFRERLPNPFAMWPVTKRNCSVPINFN